MGITRKQMKEKETKNILKDRLRAKEIMKNFPSLEAQQTLCAIQSLNNESYKNYVQQCDRLV